MQDSGHFKFVSFLDKLILKLGIDRVFTSHAKQTSPSEETTNEEVTTRAWLAAEILCTWKWPGGSAVSSILPLLCAYAKSSNGPSESLLDSIFNILLDGALVHGGCHGQSYVSPWAVSISEVDLIEEPFLRALVYFVSTLFKDSIWERSKAMTVFELLVNKLWIGEAVNINCLRILPRLVTILVQPLFKSACGETSGVAECHIQDIVTGWLQKTLSFPPLGGSETGQGKWIQFYKELQRVVNGSCIPLCSFYSNFFFINWINFFFFVCV